MPLLLTIFVTGQVKKKWNRNFIQKIMIPRLSRSDISAIYHEGEEAVIRLVESFQDALALLEARIAVLEAQQKKNSTNSSKPPSTDGLRRTQSSREPTGKKPGGQDGHAGRTLERSSTPDVVVVHEAPTVCPSCEQPMASVVSECAETRQVFDVPKVAVQVTEHQVHARVCPCCHLRSKASFPQDVEAPVQYGSRLTALAVYLTMYHLVSRERTVEILKELCGVSISNGTLETMLARAYQATESTEEAIVAALIDSDTLHADETGVRVTARTDWIHVLATERLTYYHPSVYRGWDAHDETRILERFAERNAKGDSEGGGILHSDFYASYRCYPCLHAYCNAHLLRELRFLAEVRNHQWAHELRTLLQQTWHSLKTERHSRHHNDSTNPLWVLPAAMLDNLHNRFDGLVEAALRLHPRTTERAEGTSPKGRIKQTQERLLLERLRDFKADMLRFAVNPLAAFDNNLAERDLRMIKVQQKISGSFRSTTGAKVFCRLRGFCSTVGKQSASILDALMDAFAGIPFELAL